MENAMPETHSELRRWSKDDFPLDPDDELEMSIAQEILPRGHWLALDYSADDEMAIALMRNESGVHE